jgi:hypothetical protein
MGTHPTSCGQASHPDLPAGAIQNLETLVLTNNRIADLKVSPPCTRLVCSPSTPLYATHSVHCLLRVSVPEWHLQLTLGNTSCVSRCMRDSLHAPGKPAVCFVRLLEAPCSRSSTPPPCLVGVVADCAAAAAAAAWPCGCHYAHTTTLHILLPLGRPAGPGPTQHAPQADSPQPSQQPSGN